MFSFVSGFILLLLIGIVAWSYLSADNTPHRRPALVDRPLHKHEPATPALAPAVTSAPTPAPARPAELLPIAPANLRVTSIALGDVHLAIVNGRRVAEGDLLPFKNAGDQVALRVDKIEDGIVHFSYGTQTIDAKLTPVPKTTAPTPP